MIVDGCLGYKALNRITSQHNIRTCISVRIEQVSKNKQARQRIIMGHARIDSCRFLLVKENKLEVFVGGSDVCILPWSKTWSGLCRLRHMLRHWIFSNSHELAWLCKGHSVRRLVKVTQCGASSGVENSSSSPWAWTPTIPSY